MASIHNPQTLELSRLVGDTFPDDATVWWGTGQDVAQLFDGTELLFQDSSSDTVLSLDPATTELEMIRNGATVTGEIPKITLYLPLDADTWSPFVVPNDNWPIGEINFDAQDGAGSRETFAAFRAGVRGSANSATATVESSGMQVLIMNEGSLSVQAEWEGATAEGIGWAPTLKHYGYTIHDTGYALLVGGNQAAFLFSGGVASGTGLFFNTGAGITQGYDFTNAFGNSIGRFTTGGGGACLVPASGNVIASGFDVLTPGEMPLGRAQATLVKCYTEFEIDDANDFVLGTTTGTIIATTTAEMLGFWGATAIVQPVGAAQAAITNSTGGTANNTLVAISGSGDDAAINDNFTELWELQDAMRTALVNAGLIKGAA